MEPSKTLITKTIRLDFTLAEAATHEAEQLGLSFNDVVEKALAAHLNMPQNPGFDVLKAIREFLLGAYPDRTGFPQDVTLEVFRQMQTDEHMWSLYEAATTDEDGNTVEALRDSLHRRIGRAVKAVLGATVIGRSLPLDPSVELIRSHALLAPFAQASEGGNR